MEDEHFKTEKEGRIFKRKTTGKEDRFQNGRQHKMDSKQSKN